MTENEAIEKIKKQICNEKGVQRYCRDNCMHGIEHCAYSMAIQAFEEIQQYRAIGTVEDFKAFKTEVSEYYCSEHDKEVRAKTIDDFAERLKKRYPIMENGLFTVNDTLHTIIYEVAEQLKGEKQ